MKEFFKSNKLKIILLCIVLIIAICVAFIIYYRYGKNKNTTTYENSYTYGNTQENQMNGGILVEDEQYVFYCVKDYRDKNYIFRETKETGETIELTTTNASFLNIYNDYLYYINDENSVFKMKKDGSDRQRIIEEATSMYVENNYLYYINDNMFDGLFKLNLETNKSKEIIGTGVIEFIVYKGNIYYISDEDNMLYKADVNGKNIQIISTDYLSNICIVNDKIYAINHTDGNSIYEINLDDGKSRRILSMDSALKNNGYIIVSNKIGVLQKYGASRYLYFYDFSGQKVGQVLVEEIYNGLGMYLPNNTKFGVFGNNILIDTNYKRYKFINVNDMQS